MSQEYKGKILLIEGDIGMRGGIEGMLEGAGYEVVFVEDPGAVEYLAERMEGDVLLVGMRCPEEKVTEGLRRMEVPVVVVTDASGVDRWDEEMGDGVYDYAMVPVERSVLLRVVGRAVEKRRLSDEVSRWKQRVDALESDRMAERNLAAVGQLVNGIVHNLNGPLTTILGRAELLHMRHLDIKGLDELSARANAMREMIHTMIRRDILGRDRDKQLIDLNELLLLELRFLEADLAFKHEIEKVYRFAESLPRVVGVYGELSQSFVGIVQNAIDAMEHSEEKVLTVATRADERFVYVEIADTGCGIPEEHLPKVFDPLFTTKPVAKGGANSWESGLKLATCRRLIRSNSGEIEVQSETGQGTKVSVRIPVAGDEKSR